MRLSRLLAGILFAGLVGLCNPSGSQAYQWMKGRMLQTYSEWKKKTDTPSKVRRFFEDHLQYFRDRQGAFTNHRNETRAVGNNYMQDPIDTYLRGGGDCEDFAALASDWLNSHGYETKIVAFFEPDKGHAVCAVKEQERWSYLGNDGYYSGFKTIDDLVNKNSYGWYMYQELEPDQSEYISYRTRLTIIKEEKK